VTALTPTNMTPTKSLILLLRLSMAWVFLYAASHQVFVANFSVAGFLNGTKTFHALFAPLTAPGIVVIVSFLVAYGHLLIGLSLLSGLLVRVSSIAGIGIMMVYWMAHMDFPFISDTNNFLVDEHIVFALVLGLLIVTHAGHILGLDGWAAKQGQVRHNRMLGWATA
jgi:thiosulfate dehydrogenase (quinone) large subunit